MVGEFQNVFVIALKASQVIKCAASYLRSIALMNMEPPMAFAKELCQCAYKMSMMVSISEVWFVGWDLVFSNTAQDNVGLNTGMSGNPVSLML